VATVSLFSLSRCLAHFPVYNENLSGRKHRSIADHLIGDVALLGAIALTVLYLH
jgi:hypothetical protein